jgi:23S rRNA (pseudouridine1915-N3)-methyltransferase
MRLMIIAVGRLKTGPERALVDTYAARLSSAPAQIGPLTLHEIDERKDARGISQAMDEAIARLPPGTPLIALDERGAELTSEALAARLAGWRDEGAPEAAFLIGAADGLPKTIRARAWLTLAFGRLTWPHLLARAMLAEQLYRAATILSGHPYHRA